jgi:hypothetical protein
MKRISDVLTSILIVPILLLATLGVGIYFGVRFPIWYYNHKVKKRK